ncbi:MAG: hypothetical protein ACK56I_23285, partial [bacterium]
RKCPSPPPAPCLRRVRRPHTALRPGAIALRPAPPFPPPTHGAPSARANTDLFRGSVVHRRWTDTALRASPASARDVRPRAVRRGWTAPNRRVAARLGSLRRGTQRAFASIVPEAQMPCRLPPPPPPIRPPNLRHARRTCTRAT